MNIKDFQTAWLTAAGQALETCTSARDLSGRQLVSAAGLRARTGLSAGAKLLLVDDIPFYSDLCPPDVYI